MIVNLWRFRGFIFKSAAADLRFRYAGSAMGIFWHVLNPLAQIVIYTLVFSQVMLVRVPGLTSGTAFALYLCSGLLPWLAFSECIVRGANAFLENASYLRKLPIPEQVFVARNALAATLGLGISMTLLLVVNLVIGGTFSVTWLGLPLVLILLQGFGFGVGLVCSTLNVFFRDLGQMLGIGLHLWMWCTPIVYLQEILPLRLQNLLGYNPAYPFIDALHRTTVYGQWPDGSQWAGMTLWAFGTPILGYLVLRRLRPELRDML